MSVYGKSPKEIDYKICMGLRNVTIDICWVFGGKVQSIFVEMLFAGAQKYTNLFRPCPYSVFACNLNISIIIFKRKNFVFNLFIWFCSKRVIYTWEIGLSMILCCHHEYRPARITFKIYRYQKYMENSAWLANIDCISR